MSDLMNLELCREHSQYTSAFNTKTGTPVWNVWISEMENHEGLVFSGAVWSDVKKRLSKSFSRYEKAAERCNQIFQSKLKESWEKNVIMWFNDIKGIIEECERYIKKKTETSKNYQELKLVFENAPELQPQNIQVMEEEKKKFDDKMDNKKFGYVTRRKSFYDNVINQVAINTNKLEDLYTHGVKRAKSIIKLNSDQQNIKNRLLEMTNEVFEIDGLKLNTQERLMQPLVDRDKATLYSQISSHVQSQQAKPNQQFAHPNVNPFNPFKLLTNPTSSIHPSLLANSPIPSLQVPPTPSIVISSNAALQSHSAQPWSSLIPSVSSSSPIEEAKLNFEWPKTLHSYFYKNRGQDVYMVDISGVILKPQCFRAENLCMYRLVYSNDQKLFIIGGSNNDEYSYVYPRTRRVDILKRNSMVVAEMHTSRANFGVWVTTDQTKIFVAGGDISLEQTTDEVEVFDVAHDWWSKMPQLNEKKAMPSLFCHNDKYLYWFGGYDKQNLDNPFFDTIERLSLKDSNQKWEILSTKLPFKAASSGWIPIDQNHILIFGGWNGTSNKKVFLLKIDSLDQEQSKIEIQDMGELPLGDHFEQNNIFAYSPDNKLVISGHYAVHYMNTSTLKFESIKYH